MFVTLESGAVQLGTFAHIALAEEAAWPCLPARMIPISARLFTSKGRSTYG
jgi:hypothetical protein